MNLFNNIYKKRKVLITGHTGFKGSWLCLFLNQLGADIYGFALEPPTNPSLYKEAKIDELVTSYIGDIRDLMKLKEVLQKVQPEIVIHMAAQSLVHESYKNPVETYAINVMGTVHLFEACRFTSSVKAIVNVTTDKCYNNMEWNWGYRENDPLGGYDPYSNSKGCSELVTSSFRNSYFNTRNSEKQCVAIATARAGNVIGGGDYANDRLIPDFFKAITKGERIKLRNPNAIRPWQHVLEPLTGYLILAEKLFTEGTAYAQSWNFGPDDNDAQSVEWITKNICDMWGEGADYGLDANTYPHESNYLKLDCSNAKVNLGWFPKWNIQTTLKSIVDWNKAYLKNENMRDITIEQIKKHINQ